MYRLRACFFHCACKSLVRVPYRSYSLFMLMTWSCSQLVMHASCACRNPREYFAIFDAAMCVEADGSRACFELVSCKCVDTYVRVKHNQNQARTCMLLQHACINPITSQ